MTTRTTSTRVAFFRSFQLDGMDCEHPAGCYMVETDEELLEGISFPVYRRTGTYIVLPGPRGSSIASETFNIVPDDLRAALSRDLEGALAASVRTQRDELTLNDLVTDHITQMAIAVSKTPLTLGRSGEHLRDLINRHASIALEPR